MKIQVNSDHTVAVDARLMRVVEGKVRRVLGRFAIRLTRVEIHLSDVDNKKTGQADKRCLIEVRPAGARPLVASANATKLVPAVIEALGRMQRLLTSFFGRMGRKAAVSVPVSTAKNTGARMTVAEKTTSKKANKEKNKKKQAKSKGSAGKKVAPIKSAVEKNVAMKRAELKAKAGSKRTIGKKTASALKKQVQRKSPSVETVPSAPKGLEAWPGKQSGDLQGLSKVESADSESVDELLEEGNAFEAEAVKGVQDAGDAEEREIRTHEVPQDDVPGEYRNK